MEAQNRDSREPIFTAGDDTPQAFIAIQRDVYGAFNRNSQFNANASPINALAAHSETSGKWLPSLTVTSQAPVEQNTNSTRYHRQITFSRELPAQKPGKAASTSNMKEFDSNLFTAINNWRKNHGLRELKFDTKMQKMAATNTKAMAQRGQLGHLAYGGYEVAGWNYGTANNTLRGWLNSPAHRDIISNPHLTKMGPSGNPKWQTVHFA